MERTKHITNCAILFIVLTIIISPASIYSAETDKYTVMMRIQETVQIIKKQKQAGKLKPFKIRPLMQKVQKNFKAGNLKKVDKLLDEVNRILSESTKGVPQVAVEYPVIEGPYEKINIIGETSNKGTADPTVEYNSDGSVGYLIYSALEQPSKEVKFQNVKYIHTHLAKTTDNGETWTFIKRLTESVPDTVKSPFFSQLYKLGDSSIKGMWHHEVPTLVYDPDDSGKEWKLYWHKYFSADMPKGKVRPRILSHSWIMMKEASSPENLDNAEEIKLFATHTATIPAEYSFEKSTGEISEVTTYSEPASLYWNGKIYIALSYFGVPVKHKLILISSSDNGKTWDYIGVVLDGADAFGDYFNFWGTSLAEENGRLFLLAPPIHKKYGYQGDFVFEFEDIDKGKLKRDYDGGLIPLKYFPRKLPGNINTGQGDYHKYNLYGGFIMMQADKNSAPKFAQIWSTKEKIVD